ncbi:MAG: anion permease [Verrucomicrobia bacterium]|nr:MAG: anion permease [Verrucomicrobiota bacterium]
MKKKTFGQHFKHYLPLIITFVIGFALWFSPVPEGLSEKGWHMLAVFIATIVGIILKPLPMPAVALISLGVVTATNLLTPAEALSGFSNHTVWLVFAAFLIARAFIKTNLGTRIAYYFVAFFGKKTLGLSYSLICSELILAPAIPSTAARSGGIIFPIINGLSTALHSKPNDPSARNIGSFLILTSFHGCMVISAMFLTAMAGNPMIQALAAAQGIEISWGTWTKAAIVPGLVNLLILPILIYFLSPPKTKSLPDTAFFARKKLNELGRMKTPEYILLVVFIGLVIFWIFSKPLNVEVVATAFVGLGALLITNVLSWKDVVEEKGAWETLIWFATLITLASYLNTFGVIDYFAQMVVNQVTGMDWVMAFLILILVYFYSHYFFASNTAHIGAMYAATLSTAVLLGAPGLLAALILGFFSNLFGSLTHYGTSPAPILFGAGYVSLKEWWVVGGIVSVINIIIWLTVGGMWWKFLGYW